MINITKANSPTAKMFVMKLMCLSLAIKESRSSVSKGLEASLLNIDASMASQPYS